MPGLRKAAQTPPLRRRSIAASHPQNASCRGRRRTRQPRAAVRPRYRRSSGQAARRYATMEYSVAAAATSVKTTPIL